MSKSFQKAIPITKLAINIDNPRFEMVGNQVEAIEVMVKDQQRKLISLAKDIVESGLNPSELTMVSPHEKEKGHFNVLEGNRRVITLKLLNAPDIVKKRKSLHKKFKDLHKEFSKNPIKSVPCIVFTKVEDSAKWIKLKHTGENDGVGTVRWDAQQTARFDERISGKSPVALQAIDFLKHAKDVDKHIKNKLGSLPSTNLERLLCDKGIQQLLGISINEGRLLTHLKDEEILKGLSRIAKDLISKKIKVKDIYTKEDREKYIETFRPEDIPQKRNKAEGTWELASLKKGIKAKTVFSKKKSHPLSTDRGAVIPKDCILTIRDTRVNKIYLELKKLDCDNFENAAAVLLRVFVELSLDAIIDKLKLPKVTIDSKLSAKSDHVANYFEKNNILNKHQLKAIRTAASNKNNIISVDTFNAYVHNRHLAPSPKDIKTTWDNIQMFIEKVWDNIK